MLVVWWPKFARLARSMVIVAALAGICRGRRRRSDLQPGAHPACAISCPIRSGRSIVLVTLDVGNAIITFAGLLLSRPRRGAADAGMGLDGGRGPRADTAMVGGCLPRARHPVDRARLQFPRRRCARLARSASRGAGELDRAQVPGPKLAASRPARRCSQVRDLRTQFFADAGVVRAVDGVSFVGRGRRDARHRRANPGPAKPSPRCR